MQRFCQTLELYDSPELIAQYVEEHKHVWQEVKDGIREVGILNMEIYIHENRLFMIVETVDEFDWERDFERLSHLPRQAEWEAYMSRFQVSTAEQRSDEKWKRMAKIFDLNR